MDLNQELKSYVTLGDFMMDPETALRLPAYALVTPTAKWTTKQLDELLRDAIKAGDIVPRDAIAMTNPSKVKLLIALGAAARERQSMATLAAMKVMAAVPSKETAEAPRGHGAKPPKAPWPEGGITAAECNANLASFPPWPLWGE